MNARVAQAGESQDAELLAALALDRSTAVRAAVAQNPDSPEEVLLTLARDSSQVVQRALMKNSNITESVLIRLLSSNYSDVRWGVQAHPKSSASVLRAIARSKDLVAKCNLAGRNDLPLDVIHELMRDASPTVRGELAAVSRDPHVLTLAVQDPHEVTRAMVSKNPALSHEAMRILAQDPRVAVRRMMADHARADLPEDILLALVHDSDAEVRYKLAMRDVPAEIDAALLALDEPRVLEAIQRKRERQRKALRRLP